MFTDKRFVTKVSVDKRGRPKNFATKENFEKFYDLETSSEDDDGGKEEGVEEQERPTEVERVKKSEKKLKQKLKVEESKKSKDKGDKKVGKRDELKAQKVAKAKKAAAATKEEEEDEGSSSSGSESESDVDQKILEKLRSDAVDYARGEANLLSDSR